MATKHASPTVGTSAVDLGADYSTRRPDDLVMCMTVQNTTSNPIYLGGPGVTTSNYGVRLDAGAIAAFDLQSDDTIWAIAGQGGNVIHTLMTGV